jgi:hypothetical protein
VDPAGSELAGEVAGSRGECIVRASGGAKAWDGWYAHGAVRCERAPASQGSDGETRCTGASWRTLARGRQRPVTASRPPGRAGLWGPVSPALRRDARRRARASRLDGDVRAPAGVCNARHNKRSRSGRFPRRDPDAIADAMATSRQTPSMTDERALWAPWSPSTARTTSATEIARPRGSCGSEKTRATELTCARGGGDGDDDDE